MTSDAPLPKPESVRRIPPPPDQVAPAPLPETITTPSARESSRMEQANSDHPASEVIESPEPNVNYENMHSPRCNCNNCRLATGGHYETGCMGGCVSTWWHTKAKPCLQESHWGYADQFEVRPFGSYAQAQFAAQVRSGFCARLALYHYDFGDVTLNDPAKLNSRGRKRLYELAAMMVQANLHPLVIQGSPERPGLDAARLAHVLNLNSELETPMPAEWIVIGDPIPPPLSGEEAVIIHENMLRRTEAGRASFSNDDSQESTIFTGDW